MKEQSEQGNRLMDTKKRGEEETNWRAEREALTVVWKHCVET